MSARTYQVVEIYRSLQGEGARAGSVNVFIRLAGCNLTCNGESREGIYQPLCDTDFSGGCKFTLEELIAEVQRQAGGCRWVILTGGEPALQIDDDLISALHVAGLRIAIETNGTRELPEGIDWICVSPKTAAHTIKVKVAHEVKYVIPAGHALPRSPIEAKHYFISPAFDAHGLSRETLDWCVRLLYENPEWKLSLQQHKIWQLR